MGNNIKALHLGCGPVIIRESGIDWINIDIQQIFNPDLRLDVNDLRNVYQPNSIDLIWSCHMMEHLDYPYSAIKFIDDCFTILKKGSIMRLAVPDLKLIAGYYLKGSEELKKIYGEGKFYYQHDNAGERFNYFLKEWEHDICYDEEMLNDIFKAAGFSNYGKRNFRESKIPRWSHDRLEGESLFYEAIK
jgi:predicted SAM-dependent methyltransferase